MASMDVDEFKAAAKHSAKRRLDLRPNQKCEVCDAPFYASPGHRAAGWGRACSFRCRDILRRQVAGVECSCPRCGAVFRQKESAVANGKGRVYCSRSCRYAGALTKLACEQCGTEFSIATSIAKEGRRWCSKECQLVSIKPKNNCVCVMCGTAFYTKGITRKSVKKGAGSFCSQNCKSRFMSSSHLTVSGVPRGHRRSCKGGRRPDLGNRYFRSGWEANWARYLNWLLSRGEIMAWEFEAETFEFPVKRGSKFYTPDFKITNRDGSVEYHEVKGWMDPKSATKLKRMRIHYPKIKIVLVDSKQYQSVGKIVSRLIPTWE